MAGTAGAPFGWDDIPSELADTLRRCGLTPEAIRPDDNPEGHDGGEPGFDDTTWELITAPVPGGAGQVGAAPLRGDPTGGPARSAVHTAERISRPTADDRRCALARLASLSLPRSATPVTAERATEPVSGPVDEPDTDEPHGGPATGPVDEPVRSLGPPPGTNAGLCPVALRVICGLLTDIPRERARPHAPGADRSLRTPTRVPVPAPWDARHPTCPIHSERIQAPARAPPTRPDFLAATVGSTTTTRRPVRADAQLSRAR